MDLGWTPTLVIAALALALFLGARARAARAADPGRPRLVPYTFIQLLAAIVMLLMAAHMLTLGFGPRG